MSNGVLDFLETNVFEPIQGFGEKIGDARFKEGTLNRDDFIAEEAKKIEARLDVTNPEGKGIENASNAEMLAAENYDNYQKEQMTLFGQLTTPRALGTGLGIAAAIMAGRESQRRYDDYMKNRPTYDPGQNPFMANGGGIQAFADGNKVEPIGQQKLSEMMIMNLKEKPTSTMIKLMTAIDSPEILAAFLGMNQGGGIQGFAKGTPEFPRMTGNIQGPGTGTSDSIPAMLSDGEHVLTKQEVSQIGGGDNDLGHQRLYAMRQDLRSKARSNGIGRM